MPTPEDKAREHIDEALAKAGWNCQEKTPDPFSRPSNRSRNSGWGWSSTTPMLWIQHLARGGDACAC